MKAAGKRSKISKMTGNRAVWILLLIGATLLAIVFLTFSSFADTDSNESLVVAQLIGENRLEKGDSSEWTLIVKNNSKQAIENVRCRWTLTSGLSSSDGLSDYVEILSAGEEFTEIKMITAADNISSLGWIFWLGIGLLVLIVLAAIVFGVVWIHRKKNHPVIFPLLFLLCGGLWMGVLLSSSVFADTSAENISVEKEVLVDGKRTEKILVEIEYDHSVVFNEQAEKCDTGSVNLSAPILYLDSNESAQVLRAAGDLQTDFEKVTGQKPELISQVDELSDTVILVGTIGKSQWIDQLAESGLLDISDVENQWEGYTIAVYQNLTDTISNAVVIVGSDMRGTIYGIYELSEQIGVSPWYWWADVAIPVQKSLSLSVSSLTQTQFPDVRYRGIFINDEENFAAWSTQFQNRTSSQGAPNPATYARVFELLLRLKANTLFPAMHATSTAFNAIINPNTGSSYNAELADSYGIVMGSSHCEMMLCNNETEWEPWCIANEGKYNLIKINNSWKDSYDYTVNAEAMNAYWEERVASNYRFENIYTIGLRGVHDSGINCSALTDTSYESKAKVVQAAVEAQLAILEKYEKIASEEMGKEVKFATCYVPYKEAAEYYKYDLSLPSDCMILFCDDNYGYVRQLPTQTELETYSGFGVYYHVSYYGVPRSYLWIDSTPLSLIYEEMNKAYTAGSDDFWILNVGDLKPAEMSIDFFMSLAWSASSISGDQLDLYMEKFFQETFGISDEESELLAQAMTSFYQIAYAYKAEYQGYEEGVEYSLTDFGDEAERILAQMYEIETCSEAIYNQLSEERKDSYYEIVHYKIRSTRLTLEKNIYEQKNQLAIDQGRFASVNAYAALAEAAYQQILEDITTYNSIGNGKWRKILNPYQTANGLPVIDGAPSVTYLSADLAEDGIGVAVEGQNDESLIDLTFYNLSDTQYFLDIFNKGLSLASYTIQGDPWILLVNAKDEKLNPSTSSEWLYHGEVEVEQRLWIAIDWELAPSGTSVSELVVSDSVGNIYRISLQLVQSSVDPASETVKGYYEEGGIISIEAEHYSQNVAVGNLEWKIVKNLGVSGDSMKVYPDLSADSVRIDRDYEENSPYLEYTIYISNPGTYDGTFYRIPTLNEGNTDSGTRKTCRVGYCVDNQTVKILRGNSVVDTGTSSTWSDGVRYNIEKMTFTVSFDSVGWHTLRIYQVDAGIAFDKIVLSLQSVDLPSSRLGAPESYQNLFEVSSLTKAVIPDFTLEEITFAEAGSEESYRFDFTNNASSAMDGYIGVDLSTMSSKVKRYEWLEGFESLTAFKRSTEKTSVRDLGFIYSDSPATIRLNVGTSGVYSVTLAVGDRSSNGKNVSNMTVQTDNQTLLSGISVAAGSTSEYTFLIDSLDGKITLSFGGSWAVSAIEILPYQEVVVGGKEAFEPDEKGDIQIEAEAALLQTEYAYSTESTDGKQMYWMKTGGIYGTALFFGPNKNSSYTSTDLKTSKSAQLHYVIEAPIGNYSVWVLVKCQNDNDDSLIFGLDQAQVQVANDFQNTDGFKWIRIGSLRVTESGEHTLTISGREDGLVLDKIVLTTKSNWSE